MKQIIENYRMGQAQLKTRVAQLKNSLSDRTLSLMERQNLDRRRRLLLEEYYEMEQLIRGALLHDYFLYDWHDGKGRHFHGFTHPGCAKRNAEMDYTLSPRVKNIIARHMFPLTPVPPTCTEAWIVCIADKICAIEETLFKR